MNRIINNRKIDTSEKDIIESENIPIDTTQYKKGKTEKNKMNRHDCNYYEPTKKYISEYKLIKFVNVWFKKGHVAVALLNARLVALCWFR